MLKFFDGMEKVLKVLVGVLMIVLSVNVLVQVLARWLKIPAVFTDEIARFSFMWMAMLAASVQVRKRLHFAVTILTDSFKRKRLLNLATYLLMLFVSWMLFYHGLRYTKLGLKKLAATIDMTMIWVYAAIPAGSLFMMLFLVELILGELWPSRFAPVPERHPESLVAGVGGEESL